MLSLQYLDRFTHTDQAAVLSTATGDDMLSGEELSESDVSEVVEGADNMYGPDAIAPDEWARPWSSESLALC